MTYNFDNVDKLDILNSRKKKVVTTDFGEFLNIFRKIELLE